MKKFNRPIAPWLHIAVILSSVLFAGVVGRSCTQAAFDSGQRMLTPTSDYEAQLDRIADNDPALSKFRAAFPAEWLSFRAAMATDVKSSMSLEELKRRSADRMRSFMISNIDLTASAPVAELNEMLSAEREFVEYLANHGPLLCAQYGMAGLSGTETLSTTGIGLMTEVAILRLNATQRGRDQPEKYGTLTADDANDLMSGMRNNGASSTVVSMMMTDASVGTPDEQCEGTLAIYRAIDRMPDAQAARVYSVILRAAAEQNTGSP